MDPTVRYIDDVKPMIENNLYRVRGVEGVLWAVPLYKGKARAKINPDVARGNRDDGDRAGDPARARRRLAGRGTAAANDPRRQPARPPQPDAIIVDNDRLPKLYPRRGVGRAARELGQGVLPSGSSAASSR